ncbi:YsnF/AvaK domain-containing protein, partial [Mammaliicoccus sciuri]|uniref:YsnF/AvaK domain-containing protein n=1 Tax=Mammaliicoccus sciuri TaxID=1296 RepID=UPI001F09864C
TEKTEASSFDNEAETDRDVNTNRYGNNINEEDVAHDDVDDSNINHDGTSTSANLAGASGLGAAGYANEQREQQETEDDVQDDRRVYSSDNERDLEDLNNRETTNTSAQYGETDNVKDQRDLTREDESSFSRVHDDDVETERSSLNYNKPNESVEPPTSNETTTRESNFSSSQDEQDTNVHASEQSYNNDTQDNNVDEESVQLHEERLNVDKENVETGEASVDKHVVEGEQEFDVPVEREEVTIERRPVNEKVDEDFNANDDDSVHIPLHEERVKVDKENVVSEEIVIKKNKVQDTEHVSEKVRHEEADINNPTDDNPK